MRLHVQGSGEAAEEQNRRAHYGPFWQLQVRTQLPLLTEPFPLT